MKKLLVLAFLLVGCYAPRPVFHSTLNEHVYLDPYWSWANPESQGSSLRSLTLRVLNSKYTGVEVEVSCHFEDGSLFGQETVSVDARDDKTFMVRGFAEGYVDPDNVVCGITKVR